MTDDRRSIALGAVGQSEDSVERAQKALKLYQEHLMFKRNKKEEATIDNWQAQSPPPAQVPVEPTMVEKLRKRRAEKVQLANQLDEDIKALDHEITWLERHPGSEHVMREFVREHERQIQRESPSLAQSPPRY